MLSRDYQRSAECPATRSETWRNNQSGRTDDGEEGNELHDIIPDDRADTIQALIARDYLQKRWHKLKPEYQALITRRFGLDGNEPQDLAEIAAEVGLSKQRVGQQIKKALEKLRCRIKPNSVHKAKAFHSACK